MHLKINLAQNSPPSLIYTFPQEFKRKDVK